MLSLYLKKNPESLFEYNMLEKYTCTKCGSHPSVEKEIFFGCGSCGNKLFKICEESDQSVSWLQVSKNDSNSVPQTPRDSFTSIEVAGAGVYHVNIDNLFKNSSKGKKDPLLMSDQEGVYHIKL